MEEKSIDFYVMDKLYSELEAYAEMEGISVEELSARLVLEAIPEFLEIAERDPKELVALFEQLENKYQVENHIN